MGLSPMRFCSGSRSQVAPLAIRPLSLHCLPSHVISPLIGGCGLTLSTWEIVLRQGVQGLDLSQSLPLLHTTGTDSQILKLKEPHTSLRLTFKTMRSCFSGADAHKALQSSWLCALLIKGCCHNCSHLYLTKYSCVFLLT